MPDARPFARGALAAALLAALLAGPLAAQDPGPPFRTEAVSYRNARDSTFLRGVLTLPDGAGPHPGVVLLSIAGVDPLVHHLAGLGMAVLVPERRGFVEVEPLLRATYRDLAEDGAAAVAHLRGRPEVDEARVGLIGQSDDAPPAMLAAAAAEALVPLVLLAPPGFPGTEMFRLEQRGLAERQGWRPEALEALDRFTARIAEIALEGGRPYLKEYRLQQLIAPSEVRLPYNAAFPTGPDQPHFFASPLWHDRLAFDPEEVLARLQGPVLVAVGSEDLDLPTGAWLAALRRGLAGAPTGDATVCLVPGRTRHSFTRELVAGVGVWLGERLGQPASGEPLPCLEEEPGAR